MSEDKSVVQKFGRAPAGGAQGHIQTRAHAFRGRRGIPSGSRMPPGQEVVLGDPRATRALVALMDVHAVNGGAACHWGGPAAFAEIMAAIHGIMFAARTVPGTRPIISSTTPATPKTAFTPCAANYGFDGMTFEDLKGFRGIHSKLTGHGESHLQSRKACS